MKERLNRDSYIALILFFVGCITYLFIIPYQVQEPITLHKGISSSIFPKLAILGLICVSFLLFVDSVSYKKKNDKIDDISIKKGFILILWLLLYLLLITSIGYYYSTAIFLVLFMLYLEKHNLMKYIIATIIFLITNYILFEKLLKIVLPRGIFFE